MKKALPHKVRRASSQFRRKRAKYYRYLASILKSVQGGAKFRTLFEQDAQRYDGTARGILCSYWYDLYMANGGDLADTWQDTLPDDEVAIIRVAQEAGEGAIITALSDVARVAELTDKVKSEVTWTLSSGLIAVVISTAMLTVFPVFASLKLQELYGYIPLDQWGSNGRALVNHAQRVMDYGLYVVVAIAAIVAYVHWTVEHLTGPVRDWLDTKVVLYRVVRDIKGALFLSTMATLTRKRSTVNFTLRDALVLFAQGSRSPWIRWRVEQVIDGIDQTGATDAEPFNTPLLSKEQYFYLHDTQRAQGFAEGFNQTGAYVENTLLGELLKRMLIYRWALLFMGIVVGVAVGSWSTSISVEMRDVIRNYYTNR